MCYQKLLLYSITELFELVIDYNLLMPSVFPAAEFTLHQVSYFDNQNVSGVLFYYIIYFSVEFTSSEPR